MAVITAFEQKLHTNDRVGFHATGKLVCSAAVLGVSNFLELSGNGLIKNFLIFFFCTEV